MTAAHHKAKRHKRHVRVSRMRRKRAAEYERQFYMAARVIGAEVGDVSALIHVTSVQAWVVYRPSTCTHEPPCASECGEAARWEGFKVTCSCGWRVPASTRQLGETAAFIHRKAMAQALD